MGCIDHGHCATSRGCQGGRGFPRVIRQWITRAVYSRNNDEKSPHTTNHHPPGSPPTQREMVWHVPGAQAEVGRSPTQRGITPASVSEIESGCKTTRNRATCVRLLTSLAWCEAERKRLRKRSRKRLLLFTYPI